jgi:hypothetical protein
MVQVMQDISASLQEIESLNGFSIKNLLGILEGTDLNNILIETIHEAYFKEAAEAGSNVSSGVIRTPTYVADFMVAQCVQYHKKPCNELAWYDPCVGSGEFPLAILKQSLQEQSKLLYTYRDLPSITIAELSRKGILLSCLAIELVLRDLNLNLRGYFESGRLAINCGDTLTTNGTYDLYSSNVQYDVVIGNPPYVRASRLSSKYKKQLSQLFPYSYAGSADLYYYFIANAINQLKPNGALCFISPANFFRAGSAKKLRAFLHSSIQIHALVDLDELPVFEDADIHTAIYLLNKPAHLHIDYKFKYSHLKDKEELNTLRRNNLLFESRSSKRIKVAGWAFADVYDAEELSLLENNTLPLKELGIKTYSGIRPGVKDAFVYKTHMLEHQADALDMAWFKDSFTGRNINQWSTDDTKLKLLFIPKGSTDIPEGIINLLIPFRTKLEKRPEAVKDNSWMSLRSCSYYHLFKKKKIVFPDISSNARFCLDDKQRFVLDGAFFLDSDDLCLLGILNSKIAWTYFKHHCSSIGNASNKGRVRLKKAHVDKFPMPRHYNKHSILKQNVENVVKSIIIEGESLELSDKLNEVVIALYSNN